MFGWVKEHPYLSGGVVLAVGVIYLFTRGSASSTTATTSLSAVGYDSAALVAGTNLQQQQIASQTAAATTKSNNDAAVSIATIEADAYKLAQNDALAAIQSQTNAAITINQSNNDTAIKLGSAAYTDLVSSLQDQLTKLTSVVNTNANALAVSEDMINALGRRTGGNGWTFGSVSTTGGTIKNLGYVA